MKTVLWTAAVIVVLVAFGFVFAQVWPDHTVRCAKVSSDNGTTTACICETGDRLWHDTDCDRVKDAGEEFIDAAAANNPTGAAGLVQYSDGSSGHDAEAAFNYTEGTNTLEAETYSFGDGVGVPTGPPAAVQHFGIAEYSASTQTYMYGSDANAPYPTSLGTGGVSYIEADPNSGGSGNAVFKKSFITASGVGGTFSDTVVLTGGWFRGVWSGSVTAAGTTCGTGVDMACQNCYVDTVAASADYARMETCADNGIGSVAHVLNADASDALNLCPATGGTINGGASISVPAGDLALCMCSAADTWTCFVLS